nr:uncharacterized protein LOC127300966 isoform X2 [Lolium perenne]
MSLRSLSSSTTTTTPPFPYPFKSIRGPKQTLASPLAPPSSFSFQFISVYTTERHHHKLAVAPPFYTTPRPTNATRSCVSSPRSSSPKESSGGASYRQQIADSSSTPARKSTFFVATASSPSPSSAPLFSWSPPCPSSPSAVTLQPVRVPGVCVSDSYDYSSNLPRVVSSGRAFAPARALLGLLYHGAPSQYMNQL